MGLHIYQFFYIRRPRFSFDLFRPVVPLPLYPERVVLLRLCTLLPVCLLDVTEGVLKLIQNGKRL